MLKTRQLTFSWHADLYNLIPEDHILRQIAAVVDFSFANELLAESYCKYYGRPAKEPELMLRLLFLQFLYDLSDEQVVKEAQVNLAYKWFLGLNPEDRLPDPTVLSRFRTQRLTRSEATITGILDSVVGQCMERGLIKSKRLVVDATHFAADTQMKRPLDVLRAASNKIVRAMRKQHPTLTSCLPALPPTEQLPVEEAGEHLLHHLQEIVKSVSELVPTLNGPLREAVHRAERIVQDERRLQTNGIASETDLDARVGRKSKTHMFFGYKSHVGMLAGDEIITSCHTTPGNADDGKQLPTVLKQSTDNAVPVSELLADAAYGSRANLALMERQDIVGYVPVNISVRATYTEDGFIYNKDSDQWICPAGHATYRKAHFTDRKQTLVSTGYTYFFPTETCQSCPLRATCCNGQKFGRTIRVVDEKPEQERALQRQQDPEAQKVYRLRSLIEHKLADLKRYCGLQRARYRSLHAVQIQAIMACVVANAKRMVKLAALRAA